MGKSYAEKCKGLGWGMNVFIFSTVSMMKRGGEHAQNNFQRIGAGRRQIRFKMVREGIKTLVWGSRNRLLVFHKKASTTWLF